MYQYRHDGSDAGLAIAGARRADGFEIEPITPDIMALLATLWRRKLWMVALAGILGLVALAVYLAVPPRFDATASVLIDPRGLQVVENEVTPRSATSESNGAIVESQKRVMISDPVLTQVVLREGLAEDSDFGAREPGLLASIKQAVKGLLGGSSKPTDPAVKALRILRQSVRTQRVVGSFVIDLTVRASSPDKAARIANAIAAVYLQSEFASHGDMARRTSAALEARLDELRRSVQIAEDKIEAFKAENNIVGVGGRLVGEQQLSEANTQLTQARTAAARAQSRYDQVRLLKQTGASADAIAEAVQSATIRQLRARLAAANQSAVALASQLRSGHPRMAAANAEVADLKRELAAELGRIERTAALELERANADAKRLQADLDRLTDRAVETSGAMVQMRELEREAAAARQVYQTFLVRAREISEQQGLDTSLTRIISPAVPPSERSGASLAMLLGGALFVGLGLGAVLALIREYADRTVRSPKRLVRAMDLPLLSVVPGMVDLGVPGAPAGVAGVNGPIPDHMPAVVERGGDNAQSRAFAQLRTQLVQMNPGAKGARKVLVTAAGPEQGKSTVALNLALSAARENERVVLVDGDPVRRYMSRILMPGAPTGLAELSAGAVEAANARFHDEENGIWFVAAQSGDRKFTQRLTLMGLGKALSSLEQDCDLIVIDGGVPGVDASLHMLADLVDDIVVVTREGVTDLDELTRATGALASRRDRIRGLVLLAS